MRVLVLVLVMSLSGCGTAPPTSVPKPLPIEAMEPCQIQLCKLRPEITQLDFPDQMAMLLACKEADAEAFRRCALKQAALSNWVKRQ